MFWSNFENLCRSAGSTPTAVALELGFSNATATKWKKGSTPNGTTLRKIADHFGVTTDQLLCTDSVSIKFDLRMFSQNPPNPRGVRIPVLGNVAAGIPLEAITDIEDYEEIPESMASSGEYVALRIHGDSMEPRMVDGDVVIVRVQDTIESGDTAIVIVNGGEATCKKIKKTPEGLMLIAFNPDYEPMFFSRKEVEELPVRIFGKVVELRAKFW